MMAKLPIKLPGCSLIHSIKSAIFKKWDTNHDGKLTFAEYVKARTGGRHVCPSELKKISADFRKLDTNRNGTVSRDEFVGKCNHRHLPILAQVLK